MGKKCFISVFIFDSNISLKKHYVCWSDLMYWLLLAYHFSSQEKIDNPCPNAMIWNKKTAFCGLFVAFSQKIGFIPKVSVH
jgi:hypothetical protein